ncbi:MAG: hypothetical protein WBW71_05915, partial [Bacteroidota bacterium]
SEVSVTSCENAKLTTTRHLFLLTNSPPFGTLKPMPITQRRFISYLLLVVYATGLLLVAPPHYEVDLISGSGNVQLATHADADNCKHIPISQLDLCSTCSSVSNKAILCPARLTLGFINAVTVPQIFDFSSSYTFALITSFSRRGPPSLLA